MNRSIFYKIGYALGVTVRTVKYSKEYVLEHGRGGYNWKKKDIFIVEDKEIDKHFFHEISHHLLGTKIDNLHIVEHEIASETIARFLTGNSLQKAIRKAFAWWEYKKAGYRELYSLSRVEPNYAVYYSLLEQLLNNKQLLTLRREYGLP